MLAGPELGRLCEAFLYLVRNDKSISMKENAEEQEGEGGGKNEDFKIYRFCTKSENIDGIRWEKSCFLNEIH